MLSVTAAGALLHDGMFLNTGATFLALWALEKVMEVQGISMWVAVLLGSGALVGAGSFLKSQPLWVLGMLGGGGDSMTAAMAGAL